MRGTVIELRCRSRHDEGDVAPIRPPTYADSCARGEIETDFMNVYSMSKHNNKGGLNTTHACILHKRTHTLTHTHTHTLDDESSFPYLPLPPPRPKKSRQTFLQKITPNFLQESSTQKITPNFPPKNHAKLSAKIITLKLSRKTFARFAILHRKIAKMRERERGEREKKKERTHLKLQRERSQKSGFSCPQIIHNKKEYLWLLNYKKQHFIPYKLHHRS
jgi:hypothetical protein